MRKKRPRPCSEPSGSQKRQKTDPTTNNVIFAPQLISHSTLRLYFSKVCTLRDFLLSRLPASASKARSRRLKYTGLESFTSHFADGRERSPPSGGSEQPLAAVLDKTLVCFDDRPVEEQPASRIEKDFTTFSQQSNLTPGCSFEKGTTPQSEVIDFAIWLLFHRRHRNCHKPPHLLCHGFQRASAPRKTGEDHCAIGAIPGILSHHPNSHVNTVKNVFWAEVLSLLGKEGDRIMLDLILNCGIFVVAHTGKGNLYQLSGVPLTDLPTLSSIEGKKSSSEKPTIPLKRPPSLPNSKQGFQKHTPTTIQLVRSRMLYARAALNAKGKVTFGLRHIHVLNRYRDPANLDHTVHIMKYIFPRQFGLHNVFTSSVDTRETTQPFKDYTLREQEISLAERHNSRGADHNISKGPKMPKRLRGLTVELVKKLQIRHARCSYAELLKHHCGGRRHPLAFGRSRPPATRVHDPSQGTNEASLNADLASIKKANKRPNPGGSFTDLATPTSDVSAFCRAVLSKVIPESFWGACAQGRENQSIFMLHADRFVHLRRFETMTLHTVFQRLKIKEIHWLSPSSMTETPKIALSDMRKREEIFMEFLYYVFDSLLIPLVRSNFHVTESNVHRNRLFYFRHDIWRAIAEPTLADIKLSMFEDVQTTRALKILDSRSLGFSQIRLLPKAHGMRPIMNLRRRVNKLKNGRMVLGRSINSVMTPAFNVLDYVKKTDPASVGSALFSVGDMYPILKSFRKIVVSNDSRNGSLYFAKCDVKACFDTIPQRRVTEMISRKLNQKLYRIYRHAEIKSSGTYGDSRGSISGAKPTRKFAATARAAADFVDFGQTVEEDLASGKRNTIFVDTVVQTSQQRDKIAALLQDHISNNMVKIGKKFFRQKAGIPQGSILSSLLCNLFYAELEHEYLGFLQEGESILLRLIDDFLLITKNRSHAKIFLQTMHDGIEDYGVKVNPAKSLVNFEALVDGNQIARSSGAFPYCGNLINTRTLEITKDRERRKESRLADSLTVETSRTPGKTFYRKALSAFKIQTHKMFLDTTFNSLETVLSSIYQNFYEVAMKYYRYRKCMKGASGPHGTLLIDTIRDLVELAFTLIKAKHKDNVQQDYSCAVNQRQVQWLAAQAFRRVLGSKQTAFPDVIRWLDDSIVNVRPSSGKEASKLARAVKQGNEVFRHYRY